MRTVTIGQDQERFDRLDSTNSELLRRLKKEPLPEGKLIRADQQTAGRGQRGSSWESRMGADLTFSVLLFPKRLSPEEQFDLSRAVTLGIAEAIMYLHPPSNDHIRIKWPNDVLLGDQKLAGVLIENQVQGAWIGNSVVGIGFDLRSTEREIRLGHTSLESATGVVIDEEEMLQCLCKGLERRYFQLDQGDVKGIRENFHERCYLLGHWGTFSNEEERFSARVRGVDPSGRLVLEKADGKELRYAAKELRFLDPTP
ncbi:MAG: biotin--[acetyl-CoA-carboxylase] ligase [Flavobacteriales bacterium]